LAQERSQREQAIGVIDEYLMAADICIKKVKPDGGVLGYPAALLLLCAVDAIGHGVLPPNDDFTRLDVLATENFGSVLTKDQAKQVKEWYRHLLAHTGTMAVGVHLEPGSDGEPFEFDNTGAPILIRVSKLYEITNSSWQRVVKATFAPPPNAAKKKWPDPTAQPSSFGSARSPAASGVAQQP
jgi:hypothetical protein